MDAAVIEFDSLPDAIRAGAEDQHTSRVRRRRRLVGLAPGRVVVGRRRLHFTGARVDAPVGRPNAAGAPLCARDLLGRIAPPGDLGVREAESLQLPPVVRDEVVDAGPGDLRTAELFVEPRMRAVWQAPCVDSVELARTPRLAECLREGPADPHRLADGLHLCSKRPIRTRELLEREARELHDHVVERRLEARRRRPREIVRDLLERVADGELRRDLCDRIARRLRSERGGARHTRIHLDHPELSGLAIARELDVRAAALHTDGADHRDRRVAELLVSVIGERHLGRDRHAVARVHAHRIDVLDRADDHDVVEPVAHDLQLEFVPTAYRLLDENLSDRALCEAELDLPPELVARLDETAAVTAQRECRSDDRGCRQACQLFHVSHDA